MKSDFEWSVVPANTFWPSNDGIPAGEEWEIYISLPSGNNTVYLFKDEKSMELCKEQGGIFQSFPAQQSFEFVSGGTNVFTESISGEGFKLTKEEKIRCAIAIIVRARRIR